MSAPMSTAGERDDERWMRRALELARRGEGLTRPNPPVGAVLVRGGRPVGEGWHRRAGGPHAEEIALRRAGARARGATLYVTLEPCCTWGRRPPCTDAIRAAGVARVVAAIRDPNPRHRGRGLRLLAAAGLDVRVGVCREAAAELIEPFARWILSGRPLVTLKLACTLDGRIADRYGQSRWITGRAARREVQHLRQRVDAILVGRETVVRDDPMLWPRPARGRQPWRVVVASHGELPPQARVLTDEHAAHTIVAVSEACPGDREAALRRTPITVWRVPANGTGRVDLHALMRELGRLGVLHVLCEGGGTLAAALWEAGLVDRIEWFVAPRLLGGDGRPALAGGWPLERAPMLRWVEVRPLGRDLWIRARPLRVRQAPMAGTDHGACSGPRGL